MAMLVVVVAHRVPFTLFRQDCMRSPTLPEFFYLLSCCWHEFCAPVDIIGKLARYVESLAKIRGKFLSLSAKQRTYKKLASYVAINKLASVQMLQGKEEQRKKSTDE